MTSQNSGKGANKPKANPQSEASVASSIDYVPRRPRDTGRSKPPTLPVESEAKQETSAEEVHHTLAEVLPDLRDEQKSRARPVDTMPLSTASAHTQGVQTYERAANAGVRDIVGRIASGALVAAGVSTVALLAAGGLASVILPAVAGKIALDTFAEWLVETGGETLKGWIADWAKNKVFKPENKQADTERLARDLDQAMRRNGVLAEAVANLLKKLDALNEVVAELREKAVEQARFVKRLRDDLASTRLENQRLRAWTEQLECQLAATQTASAASSSDTPAPIGTPAVGQQPPTGPPEQVQSDLLDQLLQRELKKES
jgi:hypothetical protein